MEKVLMDKSNLEIVVAKYHEDLTWAEKYKKFLTVYNKGPDLVNIGEVVSLKNIGREAHTYLYHIVYNYYSLADYTCFLQGNPIPHMPYTNSIEILDKIIQTIDNVADFYWISEWMFECYFDCEKDQHYNELVRSGKKVSIQNSCVHPTIPLAFEKLFGKKPTTDKITFGQGAQFLASRKLIHQKPCKFYKDILDIFEYVPKETISKEMSLLMGNIELGEEFLPSNPNLSYYMERFWGVIFNEL